MEGSEVQGFIKSIGDCISVLQGDLHQPGATAIVLKLAASWQKLHPFLTNLLQNGVNPHHQSSTQGQQCESGSTDAQSGTISEGTSSSINTDVQAPLTVARDNVEGDGTVDVPGGVATQLSAPPSESGSGLGNQETASEAIETQSSGLLIESHPRQWNLPQTFSVSPSPPLLSR